MESNSLKPHSEETIPNFESFTQNFKKQYFSEYDADKLTAEWRYAIQKKGIFLYTLAEEEAEESDPDHSNHDVTIKVENSIFIDKDLRIKVYSGRKRIECDESIQLTQYAQLTEIMRIVEQPEPPEDVEGTDQILCDLEEDYALEPDQTDGVMSNESYQDVEYLDTDCGPFNAIFPKEVLVKGLQCSTCGKSFKKASTLRDHLNIHANLRPYVCSTCNRSFSFETSLVEHIKLHENVRNHKCSYCSKAFARKRNMALHEKIVHLNEKPFICPVCEKPYTDRACWKNHIATHQGPKEATPRLPSVISTIKVQTPRPKNKKTLPPAPVRTAWPMVKKPRQRRNTGPKRFKCDLCEKMFVRRRNVVHHMTYTHNKIKPYECEFCSKKYSDITSFKRHIRGHTDPTIQQQLTPQEPESATDTTMVSELLVGELGELEFAPEGNEGTITFIVITEN